MAQTINVMSVSGGKDSAAMWIYAIKELGMEVMPVFCDTGNEHPLTYEYVDYLESQLGPVKRIKADFSERIIKKRQYIVEHWATDLMKDVAGRWKLLESYLVDDEYGNDIQPSKEPVPQSEEVIVRNNSGLWKWMPPIKGMSLTEANELVERVVCLMQPTGNPFLDLCIWKGRFPSTKARFCTQFLKIIPTMEQVYMPLLEDGHKVVSWQGVRAAESLARSKLSEREDTPEGYSIYRPLLKWTARDVFDMHRKHGIKHNPLYEMGMGRVGCMPCINVNKNELFEIQRRFPDQIERIAEWERIVAKVSKRQGASFLPALVDDGKKDIYEWVEWSKSSYGGKQYDLIKMIEQEEFPQCSSVYGLCE